jgi:hypothetical protein
MEPPAPPDAIAMKMRIFASIVTLLAGASVATAQQPLVRRIDSPPTATLQTPLPASEPFSAPNLSVPAVTPELWVYSQELRRHDDPAQAVRRKAEIQADQRLSRLGAMKWYGLSNSRPQASPLEGVYSPGWVGNGWNRYDWAPIGGPSVTYRVENYVVPR